MAGLVDQLAELGEAGLGREFVGLIDTAKEAEKTMKLRNGPATGIFDHAQCFCGECRLAAHDASCSGRLHADHTHVVGHDVVQSRAIRTRSANTACRAFSSRSA